MKARRRILAAIVVLGTIALAIAGTAGGGLTVDHPIRVIKHQMGMTGSNVVVVTNVSNVSFTVNNVTNDCGSVVRLMGGSGSTPFTLGPGSNRMLAIECLGTLPVGMQRCTFSVNDTANMTAVEFLAACETDAGSQGSALSRDKIMLDFTTVPLGQTSAPQTVRISTGPTVPVLQLQVDDPNFLIGAPCQDETGCDSTAGIFMGSSSSVDVVCRPLTSGPHVGQLFAVGDNGLGMQPIGLTCAGGAPMGPVLTLNPQNISVTMPIEVNGGTATPTMQLSNTGSGSLTVMTISNPVDNGVPGAGADWSVTSFDGACPGLPCTLMGGGPPLNAHITFDPSAFFPRPARSIIGYDDGAPQQKAFDLDGFGAGATLDLVGSNVLEFGTLSVGDPPGVQNFALRNQGTRPTTASLSASPMAPFAFPPTVTVAPGMIPIVDVMCQTTTPVSVQNRTLSITSPDHMGSIDLTMNCVVSNTATISSNPPSKSFNEHLTNDGPFMQTFMITKVGGGVIGLGAPQLADTSNPDVVLGGLTPGMATPASVTVTITPTADATISNSFTIHPATGSDLVVPFSATITTASLTTQSPVPLGTFCVGKPTTPTQVTLMSTGTATVGMAMKPAMMNAASVFQVDPVSPGSYPTSLLPGDQATALVTPDRGTAPADSITDNVVWTTDIGNQMTQVSVRFIDDGGAIAPEQINFGESPVRVVKQNAQQVTLQNCGDTPLELMDPMVPAPFVIVDQFPMVIDPAQSASFSVAFEPQTVGHVEKDLVIMSTAGDTFTVKLIGDGVTDGGGGDDDGGNIGTTSFYACGCGSSNNPTGALAIALVTCALCLRRRRR